MGLAQNFGSSYGYNREKSWQGIRLNGVTPFLSPRLKEKIPSNTLSFLCFLFIIVTLSFWFDHLHFVYNTVVVFDLVDSIYYRHTRVCERVTGVLGQGTPGVR